MTSIVAPFPNVEARWRRQQRAAPPEVSKPLPRRDKLIASPVGAKSKVLPPLIPNVGIEAAYRKRLLRLIDEMNASVSYWLESVYRNNEPVMAQDAKDDPLPTTPAWSVPKNFTGVAYGSRGHESAGNRTFAAYIDGEMLRNKIGVGRSFATAEAAEAAVRKAMAETTPADQLNAAVDRLVDQWQRKFDEAAEQMAEYFSEEVSDRVDGRLRKILKDAGWSIKFRMSPAQQDILSATVNENTSLIKSIPSQYLREVRGMVTRSVQTGRDLGQLSKDLQKQFGVTRRRAALIARDQNNKATSALTNARQRELGIRQAIWVHSSAGKHPRPTHRKNNGKRYDVEKGWYDPSVKEFIFPGQLINCRCFSRSIIPGFE